jgi:uncharacterized Zn-finger protein
MMKYLEFSVLHRVCSVPQNSALTESAPQSKDGLSSMQMYKTSTSGRTAKALLSPHTAGRKSKHTAISKAEG